MFRQGKRFVAAAGAADVDATFGTTGATALGAMVPKVIDVSGTPAAELTPRFPISVDPNGIPVRAAPPGVIVDVGVDDDAMLLEPEPHIPVIPEALSTPEVADIPDVIELPDGIEAPDIAAVAGAAAPGDIPPPSKLEADPNMDAGAVPKVEHVVLLLGIEIVPVASAGAGLMPGDAISVDPRGMPAGPTVEPVPKPSGEVAPIEGVGLAIPVTCAIAALQTISAETAAAVNESFTGILHSKAASRPPSHFDQLCSQVGRLTQGIQLNKRLCFLKPLPLRFHPHNCACVL